MKKSSLARQIKSAKSRLSSKIKKNKHELFRIDSPTRSVTNSERIIISGWYINKKIADKNVIKVRVKIDGKIFNIKYGISRKDVEESHPAIDNHLTSHCGFYGIINERSGLCSIQIDTGGGYKSIYTINIKYTSEKAYDSIYNNNLSENYAEHQSLVEARKQYYYEEKNDQTYDRHKNDPTLVAFYLPQFHPIPENDLAWGQGFTEWRNVVTAKPRFIGHRQPMLPQDLGFYDLRNKYVVKEQTDLAKKYGVGGFCFYYYWFSGKKLLDTPINIFLENKDWNFSFCICWANENWTKKWDGRSDDIIIAQKNNNDDPLKFIKDVEHILLDPRYIKHDNKPMLLIYRPKSLRNPKEISEEWRKYFKANHGVDLYLVAVMGFDTDDPRIYGFDAGLDFAPLSTLYKKSTFSGGKFPFIDVESKLLDINFEGTVVDYRRIALNEKQYPFFNFPTIKSVMPCWDNDARRKGKGMVFHNSSPDLYAKWLDSILKLETKSVTNPTIFINAWNEWAEGAFLEPSLHEGHAILSRTAEVLSKYSQNTKNKLNWPIYKISPKKKQVDLAVIVHIYYTEEWQYIEKKLMGLDEDYDLFITLPKDKTELVEPIRERFNNANIFITPNRGRDILPFLFIARRLSELGYKYFLKIHTKKSSHRVDGNIWFRNLIDQLIVEGDSTKMILNKLEKGISIIGPKDHYVSLNRYMGANEIYLKQILESLYSKKKVDKIMNKKESYGFFAGSMFWCNAKAIEPILDLYLMPEDFQSEKGQIDGTMAHAVERAISLVPQINGGILSEISRGGDVSVVKGPLIEYQHAP